MGLVTKENPCSNQHYNLGRFPIGKVVADLYLLVFPVATSTSIGDQMITLNEFRLGVGSTID